MVVFISPLIQIDTEKSGQKKEQKKTMNLAKLKKKFQELLPAKTKHLLEYHCGKQAHELKRVNKLSFSSLNHWMDPKQCVHHQLVEERHYKCNPLFPPPPFLSLILKRSDPTPSNE